MPLRRFRPNLSASRERRLSGSSQHQQQQQHSKPSSSSSSSTAGVAAEPAVLPLALCSDEVVTSDSRPLASGGPGQPTEQPTTNAATVINTEQPLSTNDTAGIGDLQTVPTLASQASQPSSASSLGSAGGVKGLRMRKRVAPVITPRTRGSRRREQPLPNVSSTTSASNHLLGDVASVDLADHSDAPSTSLSPSTSCCRQPLTATSPGHACEHHPMSFTSQSDQPAHTCTSEQTATDTSDASSRSQTSLSNHSNNDIHDRQPSSNLGSTESTQPLEAGERDMEAPGPIQRENRRGGRGRRRTSQRVSVGEGGSRGRRGRSRTGATKQSTGAKVQCWRCLNGFYGLLSYALVCLLAGMCRGEEEGGGAGLHPQCRKTEQRFVNNYSTNSCAM